jgi:hypothetical protein
MLNPDYIRAANNFSHFDAGNIIDQEAIQAFGIFDKNFSVEDLTLEQADYLAERREQWRSFVIDHFNEVCRRRAEYVPVSVCGPARYPGKQMEKRVDRIMRLSQEFSEKAERFFGNTRKRLEAMTPLEDTLERLRSDGGYHREIISSSDSYAIEKLEAKIEGLKKNHAYMKEVNMIIRAAKTEDEKVKALAPFGYNEEDARNMKIGFSSFQFQNSSAAIKRLTERLISLKRERENPTLQGWKFDGGDVVANQEIDRLQILFDNKPDVSMIAKLKKEAFRWSPRNKAWQRQLTKNAILAARRVLL